jgi:hypothetical protein
MKFAAKKTSAKVVKKTSAKASANVGFVGSFTPPGKDPVPMFYIDREDRQDANFHPFSLSINKCRLLLETPGALDAMREAVEENQTEAKPKKARK